MRFKTDENLPEEFAQELRDAGWDALSIYDQDLGGTADVQVAEICASESRVLITLDVGFGNIQAYPPADSAGILVLDCDVSFLIHSTKRMQRSQTSK